MVGIGLNQIMEKMVSVYYGVKIAMKLFGRKQRMNGKKVDNIDKLCAAIKRSLEASAAKGKKTEAKVERYDQDKVYEIKMRRWVQKIAREGF